MVLGLSLPAFTTLHVALSLVGILAGLVWLLGVIGRVHRAGWNGVFVATTLLTTLTGFLFPVATFTPARAVGIVSLIDLLVLLAAALVFKRRGAWDAIYIVTATFALYLNCFVAVVQAFLKLPPLHALAPDGAGPVFASAQGLLLILFVLLGALAFRARTAARA